MDLITKSFKRTTNVQDAPVPQSSSQDVPEDIDTDAQEYSSQDATLLEVRDQALGATTANSSKSRKKKGNKTLSKRGVPMREDFFSKIGLVWCHICKKNFSIKSKGPYEILRHHRTERHLRRDQRWRYKHLRSTDPITGKTQHRVRGGNGKLLTKVELAKELPKFKNVELVDIGERFPFYEAFVKGSTTALVTPEPVSRPNFSWSETSSKLKVICWSGAICGPGWGNSPITKPPSMTLIGGKRDCRLVQFVLVVYVRFQLRF